MGPQPCLAQNFIHGSRADPADQALVNEALKLGNLVPPLLIPADKSLVLP
jgi:hypothetical protein